MLQTHPRSSPAGPSRIRGSPAPSGTGRGTAGSRVSDKTSPYVCGHSLTSDRSVTTASHIAMMNTYIELYEQQHVQYCECSDSIFVTTLLTL